MSTEFFVITLPSGEYAAVEPEHVDTLIILARFYNSERAAEYAAYQNSKDDTTEDVAPVTADPEAPMPAKNGAASFDIDTLPGTQAAVLAALKNRADKCGIACITAREIAEYASVPQGSVAGTIGHLKKKGLIELADTDSRTNAYRLMLSRN